MLLFVVMKFQDIFASLQQLHSPNCQDKFQICCIDMYVIRFLASFAVFSVFLLIRGSTTPQNIRSRVFWYWGQDEGTANISYIICRSTESCSGSKNSLHYYKLYSLSVFSLAKSLQLILEISTTYRFRPVIHRQGPGISPGYYEHSPRLLSHENNRKIEPKEIPLFDSPATCYIYCTT